MSKFWQKSLNFYNTTEPAEEERRDGEVYPAATGTGSFFDYYDQPSKNARRLAFSSVYMQKPQPRENASTVFCGSGWNCTYTISFVGPGYQCEDVENTDESNAPFALSELAPNGSLVYLADVDQGDYGYQDPVNGTASLGVFEDEPNLWIGYAINTSEPYSQDAEPEYKAKWGNVHGKFWLCEPHVRDTPHTRKNLNRSRAYINARSPIL